MNKLLVLATLILLPGCNNQSFIELFLKVHNENKCKEITNLKVNGINYGNFIVCTKSEFYKHIKGD